MAQPDQGQRGAEPVTLERPGRCRARRPRRSARGRGCPAAGRRRAPWSSGSRPAHRRARPGRIRPGRTTTLALAGVRSSVVQSPWSGWPANARLFRPIHASSSAPGRNGPHGHAVGQRRPDRAGACSERRSCQSTRERSKPMPERERLGRRVLAVRPEPQPPVRDCARAALRRAAGRSLDAGTPVAPRARRWNLRRRRSRRGGRSRRAHRPGARSSRLRTGASPP